MGRQIPNQVLSCILIVSLVQMGCYNLRQIPVRNDPATGQKDTKIIVQILEANIGETVRIDLKNGHSITGRLISYEKPVCQIRNKVGAVEKIHHADIKAMYHENINWLKTAGVVNAASLIYLMGAGVDKDTGYIEGFWAVYFGVSFSVWYVVWFLQMKKWMSHRAAY